MRKLLFTNTANKRKQAQKLGCMLWQLTERDHATVSMLNAFCPTNEPKKKKRKEKKRKRKKRKKSHNARAKQNQNQNQIAHRVAAAHLGCVRR
jgi:hypothetical protein